MSRKDVYIIAEAGVNHNGSPEAAAALIDAAANAGANAVKFQTFRAERLVTEQADKAAYQQRTTGAAESQFEMLKRLELSESVYPSLLARCEERGIEFLSTPFDVESADFLEGLGMRRFKIPSGEITNLPFLRHVARKGLPIICSTGMSNLGEVETALDTIAQAGSCPVTLLHCVSNYPAAPEAVNLRAMETLRVAFGVPVGFSDHTLGIEVPIAAAALGAVVIEKHLTLDRSMPGPDHAASLAPFDFTAMVTAIRNVELALGDGRKRPTASEAEVARVARKGLVAACDIPAGTVIAAAHVAILRPSTGLPPSFCDALNGRIARLAIPRGTPLNFDLFQ